MIWKVSGSTIPSKSKLWTLNFEHWTLAYIHGESHEKDQNFKELFLHNHLEKLEKKHFKLKIDGNSIKIGGLITGISSFLLQITI